MGCFHVFNLSVKRVCIKSHSMCYWLEMVKGCYNDLLSNFPSTFFLEQRTLSEEKPGFPLSKLKVVETNKMLTMLHILGNPLYVRNLHVQVSMYLNHSTHVRVIFDISSCGRFLWCCFSVSTADALLVFSIGLTSWLNTMHSLPKGLQHSFLTLLSSIQCHLSCLST